MKWRTFNCSPVFYLVYYAVLAIFQPYNGGNICNSFISPWEWSTSTPYCFLMLKVRMQVNTTRYSLYNVYKVNALVKSARPLKLFNILLLLAQRIMGCCNTENNVFNILETLRHGHSTLIPASSHHWCNVMKHRF